MAPNPELLTARQAQSHLLKIPDSVFLSATAGPISSPRRNVTLGGNCFGEIGLLPCEFPSHTSQTPGCGTGPPTQTPRFAADETFLPRSFFSPPLLAERWWQQINRSADWGRQLLPITSSPLVALQPNGTT